MADSMQPAEGTDRADAMSEDERIRLGEVERTTRTVQELTERARRMNHADVSLAQAIEDMLRDRDGTDAAQ